MLPIDLFREAKATRASIVVVTGGEPAIHDLNELCHTLHGLYEPGVTFRLRVHLETSGAFPIRGNFDWITLSPKRWKLPIMETVHRANEFKFIIEAPVDIDYYSTLIQHLSGSNRVSVPIWLHPEWSKHKDPVVLDAICNAVKKQAMPFRAGWQLHKNYKVDSLDPRSMPLVPLGGNPALGF